MMKHKGIASLLVIGAILGICVIAAVVSDKFLGNDNVIEQSAETVADELIEEELHLPQGSINIDLSPTKT